MFQFTAFPKNSLIEEIKTLEKAQQMQLDFQHFWGSHLYGRDANFNIFDVLPFPEAENAIKNSEYSLDLFLAVRLAESLGIQIATMFDDAAKKGFVPKDVTLLEFTYGVDNNPDAFNPVSLNFTAKKEDGVKVELPFFKSVFVDKLDFSVGHPFVGFRFLGLLERNPVNNNPITIKVDVKSPELAIFSILNSFQQTPLFKIRSSMQISENLDMKKIVPNLNSIRF